MKSKNSSDEWSSIQDDLNDYRDLKRNNKIYSQEFIDNLNNDIKLFSNIETIHDTDHMSFDGISRLVMLDRYAQKDKLLFTLKEKDLVIVMVNYDVKFPARGIGYVKKIDGDNVTVQLEEEEWTKISENEKSSNGVIIRKKSNIEKPLEIFFEQIARRVGKALANIEVNLNKKSEYEKKFIEEISSLNIIPAGRVLYGAGSDSKVTYFNCYVMPNPIDSRSGISNHREKVMEIMSRGGGVGTNGSTLRPRNAVALSVGGRSSGAVSWLNDIAQLTHLVEQGGSRRGAQMIMLDDWHPDIVEFIISKMQNENLLRWIIKNSKDKLILQQARQKLKFIPLTSQQREINELIIKNKNSVSNEVYKSAKQMLDDNGQYEIVNSSFLTGANISVAISKDFMEAVENKSKWQLKFPDIASLTVDQKKYYDQHWHEIADVRIWESKKLPVKVYYEINARDLWDLINFCATYSAEPGVFFIDRANEMSNAGVYNQRVVATNPCGEQPLSAYSVCNLSALNLSNFVDKKNGKVLWNKLENTVRIAVRLQDNITDATPYFLSENEKQAKNERRIGMGVMGLHDMLIWLGLKYGSQESLELVDKLMNKICNWAYDESASLAQEKGTFPLLTPDLYEKMSDSNFVSKLSKTVREKIRQFGTRNSHLLTIAPTGSTGTMVGVSTGLEPYFAFEYYRSGRLGKNIKVKQAIVDEWLQLHPEYIDKPLPNFFVSAMDLTPEEHVNMQITIQKWVDSSISKTVNAPKGYSIHQVEKVYMSLYKGGAKGGTIYVDGSRDSQVLNLINEEEVDVIKKNINTLISEKLSSTIQQTEEKTNPNKEILEGNLRGERQDRNIGIELGNNCPQCSEGIIRDIGGCNTCDNCGIQWKCGL